MPLDSYQLEALVILARLRNFTLAAAELRLTQPALSKRIQALESQLGMAVFVRNPGGLELTEAGARVLRHAQATQVMERELRDELAQADSREPTALIRIAGYSSILHMVLTPALAPFLRRHPKVQLYYMATQHLRPSAKQVELLVRAEVDFLISATDFGNRELVSHSLGVQELIAVESKKYADTRNTYLDTRPEDPTTDAFFEKQNKKNADYQRSFLYDEVGILTGVAEGLGRAVVYKSLIKNETRVRPVPKMAPLRWPVYLHYRKQPFYPPLMKDLIDVMLHKGAALLD